MTGFAEVKKVLDDIAETQKLSTEENRKQIGELKTGQDDLRNRIEEIESRANSPGRAPRPGENKAPDGVQVFQSNAGAQMVIDHKTRLQDVLPAKSKPEINLTRWLAATCAGERCADTEALEFARERKQMTTTTTGIQIPIEYQPEWIDMIRSQSQLIAAGMRTTPMLGKTQSHSAVASDPATTWHTEAGTIDVGNPTFEARQLTARTVVARCQASLECAQDSADFGQQLSQVMTRAIAAEVDRVGLIGSGTGPEPQGLRGHASVTQANVGSPSASGGYFSILNAIQVLLAAGVPLDVATANILMGPGSWLVMESEPTGLSGDNSQLPRPRSLANTSFRVVPALANTGSPATSEPMFLGDFRDLLLGVRQEASIEILKAQTYATNLLLEFVGYMRLDFLVMRPASFIVNENFQTTG